MIGSGKDVGPSAGQWQIHPRVHEEPEQEAPPPLQTVGTVLAEVTSKSFDDFHELLKTIFEIWEMMLAWSNTESRGEEVSSWGRLVQLLWEVSSP